MTSRSRVCPACGALNGPGERACYRCSKSLSGWGPLLDSWFAQPDAATRVLFALCMLNFLFMSMLNGSIPIALVGAPPKLSAMIASGAIALDFAAREPWRLLSAVYGHLGILHLGMNMLALFQLGRPAERYLGSARLVILFTLTGILGFVASGIWYGQFSPPTAGASGALFGLMGHQIGVLHAQKNPNARALLFQELAFAAAFALLFPVNNAAHFGGFVSGFGLGWLFFLEKNPRRQEPIARVLAVVSLIAAVASVALSAVSPTVAEIRPYDTSSR